MVRLPDVAAHDSFLFLCVVFLSPHQPKVVTAMDEAELARQMEKAEMENAEIGGTTPSEPAHASRDYGTDAFLLFCFRSVAHRRRRRFRNGGRGQRGRKRRRRRRRGRQKGRRRMKKYVLDSWKPCCIGHWTLRWFHYTERKRVDSVLSWNLHPSLTWKEARKNPFLPSESEVDGFKRYAKHD